MASTIEELPALPLPAQDTDLTNIVRAALGSPDCKIEMQDLASYVLSKLNLNPLTATQIVIDDGSGEQLIISGDGSGNYSITETDGIGTIKFNDDGSFNIFDISGQGITLDGSGNLNLFGTSYQLINTGSAFSVRNGNSASALVINDAGGIGIYTNTLGFFAIQDDGSAAINVANAAAALADPDGNFTFYGDCHVNGTLSADSGNYNGSFQVLTALPSTFKTVTVSHGIITSVA